MPRYIEHSTRADARVEDRQALRRLDSRRAAVDGRSARYVPARAAVGVRGEPGYAAARPAGLASPGARGQARSGFDGDEHITVGLYPVRRGRGARAGKHFSRVHDDEGGGVELADEAFEVEAEELPAEPVEKTR